VLVRGSERHSGEGRVSERRSRSTGRLIYRHLYCTVTSPSSRCKSPFGVLPAGLARLIQV
jgi:hypothetical protein